MANPSKQKGTRAETNVARFLTARGLPTERKALAGSADKGDLRTILPDGTEVTLEVKAGKQTANYNRSTLNEWKRQTCVESMASGCPAALVIVRYRRSLYDAEVWLLNGRWRCGRGWTMTYLDDFADECWEREDDYVA